MPKNKLKLQRETCSPLGKFLHDYMVQNELNITDLANLCSLSAPCVRQTMFPGANPESITLGKLAEGTGLLIDDLYYLCLYGTTKDGNSPDLAQPPKAKDEDLLQAAEDEDLFREVKPSRSLTLVKAPQILTKLDLSAELDLPAQPDSNDIKLLISYQIHHGKAYLDLCMFDKARTHLSEALQMAEAHQDIYHQCMALRLLGLCSYNESLQPESLKTSLKYFGRARDLSESLKNINLAQAREQKAAALANIGNVYVTQRCFQDATAAYDRALVIAREDFPVFRWAALFGKAFVAHVRCEWAEAIEFYQMADLAYKETPSKAIHLWGNLGYVLTNYGDYDQAEVLLHKVIHFAFREEQIGLKAAAFYSLGFNEERRALAMRDKNGLAKAHAYYQESSQTKRTFEAILGAARVVAYDDIQRARLLALVGLERLREEPFTPFWDHTVNMKTLLDLLGKQAVTPVLGWVSHMDENWSLRIGYWAPLERKSLLDMLDLFTRPQ